VKAITKRSFLMESLLPLGIKISVIFQMLLDENLDFHQAN